MISRSAAMPGAVRWGYALRMVLRMLLLGAWAIVLGTGAGLPMPLVPSMYHDHAQVPPTAGHAVPAVGDAHGPIAGNDEPCGPARDPVEEHRPPCCVAGRCSPAADLARAPTAPAMAITAMEAVAMTVAVRMDGLTPAPALPPPRRAA